MVRRSGVRPTRPCRNRSERVDFGIRFGEVAARLSGFSTPLFGVSWNPPVVDREVARRVIATLEDRRVLYDPFEIEIPEEATASVQDIRLFLTELIGQGGVASELDGSLRAMRAACRKFLGATSELKWDTDPDAPWDPGFSWRGRAAPWPVDEDVSRRLNRAARLFNREFNQALGELRGIFALHVAQLAVRYGIDVEEPLSSILPLEDAD